jgi:FkbM family methyltransferase
VREAQLGDWSAVFDPRDLDIAGDDFVVVVEVWDRNDYRVTGFSGTVIDVGANVGAFTVLAAKAGARHVIAVEPTDTNRERLLHHLALNGVADEVTVLDVAVTGRSGQSVGMVGDGGGAQVAGTGDVETVTLVELLDRYGPIEMLKVDIEGGEFEAFAAVPVDALRGVERIAMEWHGPASPHLSWLEGDELARLFMLLADAGRVETFGHPARGGLLYWTRY